MFSAAGLFAATDLSCGTSEISIRMEADSDEFISMENILSGFHGMSYFGTGTFDGSSVLVEIDIPEAADPVSFANNVSGINGRSVSEEVDLKLMNKAEVVIINNAEHANGVAGIYTTGNLEVEDDCHLSAVATGRNRVLGISVDGDMTVGNGTVNGEAHSAGIYPESIEEGVYQVIGLFAQNFNVNTCSCDSFLRGSAKDDTDPDNARAIIAGWRIEQGKNAGGNESKHIHVSDDTELTTPADGEYGIVEYTDWRGTRNAETVYDMQDGEQKPVTEIVFAGCIHEWGEWETTKLPTVDEEGIETHICSRCGETEERPVPKLDPEEKDDDEKDDKTTPSEDKNKGSSGANTADTSNAGTWAAVFGGSIMMLLAVIALRASLKKETE